MNPENLPAEDLKETLDLLDRAITQGEPHFFVIPEEWIPKQWRREDSDAAELDRR